MKIELDINQNNQKALMAIADDYRLSFDAALSVLIQQAMINRTTQLQGLHRRRHKLEAFLEQLAVEKIAM